MGRFIQNNMCSGSRPRQLPRVPAFSRNDLLSRMIHDRSRVRYLLAPTGFGKTLLAASYAQMMNSFEQTVWLPGDNPCFLRDLDSGALQEGLREVEDGMPLVVFDDLPALDEGRAEALWAACRRLLDAGCEVVAMASSGANPLHAHEAECLVLGPLDLMFDDRDFAALLSTDVAVRHVGPPRGALDRVPCLASRAPGCYERFFASHLAEVGDVREQAVSMAALLLERGTSDDLSEALGTSFALADLQAGAIRPFLSVDETADSFDASGAPLDEVVYAFSHASGSIAKSVGEADASMLAQRLANMLMARGAFARAAKLMAAMAKPAVRASWLQANQDALLARCELLAGEEVYASLQGSRYRGLGLLKCGSLVRRTLLGGPAPSDAEAARALAFADAPWPGQAVAASLLYLAGEAPHGGEGKGGQALQDAWPAQTARSLQPVLTALPTGEPWHCDPFAPLAHFWESGGSLEPRALSLLDDAEQLVMAAEGGEGGAVPPALGLGAAHPWHLANAASLLVACLARACTTGMLDASHAPRIVQLGSDCLRAALLAHVEGPCELMLRQQVTDGLHRLNRGPDDKATPVRRLEALQSSLEVQQASYRRIKAAASKPHGNRRAPRPGRAYAYAAAPSDVPLLHIALFGRFDVRLGEVAVPPEHLKRSKVRTLLALLALEDGRDLSCDRLSEKLWPDSDLEHAKKNLYSTISRMKKALSLPGGDCPYLHREGGVLGLNPDVARSDISDLDLLCRKLHFDEVDPEAFLRILDQVRMVYRGELLPGEVDEPLIVAARAAWTNRIVASLMAAAHRTAELSERQIALQLAQHALEIDPRREDCYELLMSLQADCGLRPAAIETWFSYCRYVDSELGLDPAPRVKELYNRIIS